MIPSSEIGIERPEFILAIDIGLVLLGGGGSGTGFFCEFELDSTSFGSIVGSERLLMSSDIEYLDEGAQGSACSVLFLSLGELGEDGISGFQDIDGAVAERAKVSEGSSKEAIFG